MSVDSQVNVSKVDIQNSNTEQSFTIFGDLADFLKLDINPSNDKIDSSGSPLEKVYDFLVQSSGNPGVITINLRNRSVELGLNEPPTVQVISPFFSTLLATGDPEFHVIQRENRDGKATYDCFFSNEGAGAVIYELTIATLNVLPGQFPTLPTTTNAPAFMKTVLRQINGLIRVYDVFILSVP